MEFVAIDFELANERYDSARSCGVAIVKDGKLNSTQHWLIRPPELRFGWYQTAVLKVDESEYVNKPKLCDIWNEILSLLEGRVALAHSAVFDMGVMSQSLSRYGIEAPQIEYSCTCQIAQGTWDDLPNYRLNTVAKKLGLVFQHHHAEEDARACAEIALASLGHFSASSFDEWESCTGAYRNRLTRGFEDRPRISTQSKPRFTTPEIPLKELKPTVSEDDFDPAHPFFGRMIVFTGTLETFQNESNAALEVLNRGGGCKDNVCKNKTDFLVLGSFKPPKTTSGNLGKARKWGIQVIDEDTFNKLLSR